MALGGLVKLDEGLHDEESIIYPQVINTSPGKKVIASPKRGGRKYFTE